MELIKTIVMDFQKSLVEMGFTDEQIATILYETVLIASAKLTEEDLNFLSPEELELVSNKDLMQLSPEQLEELTTGNPHLGQYMDVYANKLRESIQEFNQLVEEVKNEPEGTYTDQLTDENQTDSADTANPAE